MEREIIELAINKIASRQYSARSLSRNYYQIIPLNPFIRFNCLLSSIVATFSIIDRPSGILLAHVASRFGPLALSLISIQSERKRERERESWPKRVLEISLIPGSS